MIDVSPQEGKVKTSDLDLPFIITMGPRYHLFKQEQAQSHTRIGEYEYSCKTTGHLKDVVRGQIASLPELQSWRDVEIQVYQVAVTELVVVLVASRSSREQMGGEYYRGAGVKSSSW